MPATYVTEAELESTLGISATLYSSAVVEEVCQAAENIVKKMLWFNNSPVSATSLSNNIAELTTPYPHGFVEGQVIDIELCGSTFNASNKTITEATLYTLKYAKTASDQDIHLVRPYGRIVGPAHQTDYATVAEIREAALMLAVDIWQARQAAGGQAASIDGFAPSPFRMGNTLIARIRGLLANHLSPNALVG